MYDEIRAWKDEDYREEIGLDAVPHPAGLVDLSAIGGMNNYLAPETSGGLCVSIVYSCFVSFCQMICSTLICHDTLAENPV